MRREVLGDPPGRVVERIAEGVLALPGRGLLALDAARRRQVSDSDHESAGPARPSGALVAIAHFRADPQPTERLATDVATAQAARVGHLLECVQGALELDIDRVIVAISSNQPGAVRADLAVHADRFPPGTELRELPGPDRFSEALGANRAVIVVAWKPSGLLHRHPFNLTWAHKELVCSGLREPALSHFVYLEDDVKFTGHSLSYWCKYRQPLARHGLLPGFVRVELLDHDVYVVDQLERLSCGALPRVTLTDREATVFFASLANPYQGMYVLDRPLAIDHFRRSGARDAWRSRAVSRWGTRERAALGPILDDVPPGFRARNVVPVSLEADGSCRLVPECTLEHLAGNYSRAAAAVGFGKIRLADLFIAGSAPRQ